MKLSNTMSTNFRIPTASLGAGGTWREEGQPHSHTSFPRRPSTSLLAFPSGWSTTALNDEHLKGGPGVQLLEQGVWGVVAEKEQRLGGVQKTRITRSTYSRRRRSLSGPGTVKQGNKGKRLRSNRLVKDLEREYFICFIFHNTKPLSYSVTYLSKLLSQP